MSYLPDTDVIKMELDRQKRVQEKNAHLIYMREQPPIGERWFDEWPIPPGIDEADRKLAQEFVDTIRRMFDSSGSHIHSQHLYKMLCTLIVSLRSRP